MNEQVRGISEDWLAVILGVMIFLAALATLAGIDLLGWAAAPKTWIAPAKAVLPVSAAYQLDVIIGHAILMPDQEAAVFCP